MRSGALALLLLAACARRDREFLEEESLRFRTEGEEARVEDLEKRCAAARARAEELSRELLRLSRERDRLHAEYDRLRAEIAGFSASLEEMRRTAGKEAPERAPETEGDGWKN
jgi:chromosome segregation ATPase